MTTANDEEEWRPVVGFDWYEVSNLGRVRTWRRRGRFPIRSAEPRLLDPTKIAAGYMQVGLAREGLPTYNGKVHRLVARAFHGEPKPGSDNACHNDGVRDNNRADNLRWDSMKGNHADRAKHGKTVRGARVNTAKLVDSQVLAIREVLAMGETRAEVARRFGVSWSLVDHIYRGSTWGWLASEAA